MTEEHQVGEWRHGSTSLDDPTDDVDPWARGGSMSGDSYTVWHPGPPVERAERPAGAGRRPRHAAPTLTTIAALTTSAVLAAVVLSVAWEPRRLDPDISGPPVAPERDSVPQTDSTPPDRPDALDPPDPPASGERPGSTFLPLGMSVGTPVGSIIWTRIDGDATSLPARVTGTDGTDLVGDDASGRRWRSSDGGHRWTVSDVFEVERRIGDQSWVVHHLAGRMTLSRRTPGGDDPVVLDAVNDVPSDGVAVRTEVAAEPFDGFPVELDGEIYLPVSRRVEFPWAQLTGAGPGEPYRVRVAVGDELVTAVSGDFHELPVSTFALRTMTGGDRYEILDADDDVVWSVPARLAGIEMSAAGALSGIPSTIWSRWDGDGFAPAGDAWSAGSRVDLVAIAGGVLARSATALNREIALVRTTDGRTWEQVDFPDEPRANTPVDLHAGDGEAIVTMFSATGATAWSTIDGSVFDELPDVPGIEARTRGDFGWIAPDPRSAPRIRVSPDGEAWEVVDIAGMLDVDSSRWDVSIGARAIDSSIYLVADHPTRRTLLIGHVAPTG